MKRILFAWELGAHYGHVNKIAPVAEKLVDDFDVTIAARLVKNVRELAPDLKVRLLPAPYDPTRPLHQGEKAGQCYAGALLQEGWDDPRRLIPLIEAWQSLFALVQPEILVAQAAPTALLAARGMAITPVILGSGYDTPPRSTPMTSFAPQDPTAVNLAADQEARALQSANAALAHYGLPAMDHFADLLEVKSTLLMCYPETDHFMPRAAIEPDHAPYIGQILSVTSGKEVAWRNNGGPKILAYLRPGTVQFDAGVNGLAGLGPDHDIILAAPGIDPTNASQLKERGVAVYDHPVRLDRLLDDCDLGVSHGTNGIGAAFVAYGIPQIGLPTHQEQMMFTQAIARAGIALGVAGQYAGAQVVEALQKALSSPKLRAKALAVSRDIKARGHTDPASAAAAVLRRL